LFPSLPHALSFPSPLDAGAAAVAPEQAFAPKQDSLAVPAAIENEIPTYRAVSALALTSAVCGLLAGLSFVSPWWLIVAGFAVVLGAISAWRIHVRPDTLTGRSFAHAGLAMGLMFSVSSVWYEFYSAYVLRNQSRTFAGKVVKTLNFAKTKTPLDTTEVLWWMMPPDRRKGKVPEDARAEIAQIVKDSSTVRTIEENITQMSRYAGVDQPIEILEVENSFYSDRDAYATVLLKVGEIHEGKQEEQLKKAVVGEHPEYALLVLHGLVDGRNFDWFVEQIHYPYTPRTYKAVPKKAEPVDDGHGHAH
jgi:hypothetical protein